MIPHCFVTNGVKPSHLIPVKPKNITKPSHVAPWDLNPPFSRWRRKNPLITPILAAGDVVVSPDCGVFSYPGGFGLRRLALRSDAAETLA